MCQALIRRLTVWVAPASSARLLIPNSASLSATYTLFDSGSRKALAAVNSAGHGRFVLSSGCTLAVETPPANLDALNRVVRASRFTE